MPNYLGMELEPRGKKAGKKKKGVYVCKMDEEERPFKAEYAKSGRAGCKLCKGAITKDTLRLAKMVQVSSECTLPCY